jgi:hypothetical protein
VADDGQKENSGRDWKGDKEWNEEEDGGWTRKEETDGGKIIVTRMEGK